MGQDPPEQGSIGQSSAGQGSAEETGPDKATADIGIVCVHAREIRPLLKRLDRVRRYTDRGCTFRGGFLNEVIRIAVVEAPRGFASQRMAAEALVSEHRPEWIISTGFSSALSENVRAGDLSLATEICDTHGNSIAVPCPIPGSRRVHSGRHVCADAHPLTAESKSRLRDSSGAIAVDTSSLAVAQVCQGAGIRFLSIRAIAVELAEDIPEAAAAMMFRPDSRALGSAFATVLRSLQQMSEMNRWRMRSTEASDHLDRYLTGVILRLSEKLVRDRF